MSCLTIVICNIKNIVTEKVLKEIFLHNNKFFFQRLEKYQHNLHGPYHYIGKQRNDTSPVATMLRCRGA